MKRKNWLINLCILGLLWFSLAFACSSGSDRSDGKTTSYNTTTTRQTGQNAGGAITEPQIKRFVTDWFTRDCPDYQECTVTFDSPVRIGSPENHTFGNGTTFYSYPVKVDFTNSSRNKNIGSNPSVLHHRGGTYYFYRRASGDWEMAQEGVSLDD